MKAPEWIETSRLILRKPSIDDAVAVFTCYASIPAVTNYLSWPTHTNLIDTRQFLEFAEEAWHRWPAGPYLIESRISGELLGSTGIDFETPYRAATGYVLAKEAWGYGYATESVNAMIEIAPTLGIQRLEALCHHQHTASAHVLAKCSFILEGILHRHTVFPNLSVSDAQDVMCFARVFD